MNSTSLSSSTHARAAQVADPRRHDWLPSLATLHATPKRTDLTQTALEETPTTTSAVPTDMREADMLRAAFRDLHTARLHGFALLVTLGDRARAAQATSTAVAAGARRAVELRHPERAAAWLRRRALKELRRTRPSHHLNAAERQAALAEIGAAEPAIAALEELTLERRTALVAGLVERFTLPDVATILDTDLVGAQRALKGARREYLTAAGHWMRELPSAAVPGGALADRVDEVATRAVGPRRIES